MQHKIIKKKEKKKKIYYVIKFGFNCYTIKNIISNLCLRHYACAPTSYLDSKSPKVTVMKVKETAFPNINFAIPYSSNEIPIGTNYLPVGFVQFSSSKQAKQKNLHNPRRPRNKQTKILLPIKQNENAAMGKTCKFNTFASNNSLLAAVKVCRKTMESRNAPTVLRWLIKS